MGLKIYKKSGVVESLVNKNDASMLQGLEVFETPRLLRRDGIFYIGYETDLIEIEPWEAEEVYHHPETVYDVIVSHRRKYYFNTAEDTIR